MPGLTQARSNRRRAAWLAGAAAAALAAGLGLAGQVSAQAFKGNPTVVHGSAFRSTGVNSETITVVSDSAVINWDPTDVAGLGTIDFLPEGATATFQNGPSNSNFIVLNRIIPLDPKRAVALNGTVISQLQDSGGQVVRGGTVAFYSPGGIFIGGKAVIDVGSLLLTTIDPVLDGSGNFFFNSAYDLSKAVDPASFITVSKGAKLNALEPGSHIALVSPRITQSGDVRVNGAAAYVAAESAKLTLKGGLFDIEVAVGSSSVLNTLVHDGTTGGPASAAADDPHRIYMVAVPKNAAITALLSGAAGFDAAADASIVNGEIILSAGRNVVGEGFVDPAKLPASNFHILSGTYSSSIRGSATGDFIAGSNAAGLTVNGNVALQGDARAWLVADNKSVQINGNLELRSDRIIETAAIDGTIDAAAGEAAILSTGDAQVVVTGNALISADAQGGFDSVANLAGTGTGGTARIVADAGRVDIAGTLTLSANGSAGSGPTVPAAGAIGQGGAASLLALNFGEINVTGTTQIDASGLAGLSNSIDPGGTGTGGQILLSAESDGLITLQAALGATAQGVGGNNDHGAGFGGPGFGGDVRISAEGGGVDLQGGGFARSLGTGGRGFTGGTGTGGDASVEATSGTVQLGGGFELAANGQGGVVGDLNGGRGGDGVGGNALVLARSGAAPSSIVAGDLFVLAQGQGGAGGLGSGAVASGGRGGDGTGGSARASAEAANGTLSGVKVTVQAAGTGGAGGPGGDNRDGGRGGDGRGGTALAGTVAGESGAAVAGSATFAALQLRSQGAGGAGGAGGGGLPTTGGSGGTGRGGSAELASAGAPVTIPGGAALDSNGSGGAAGSGSGGPGATGQGQGGQVRLSAFRAPFAATPGSIAGGAVTGQADGVGGGPASPAGRFTVDIDNGVIALASLDLRAVPSGTPLGETTSSANVANGTIETSGALSLLSGGNLQLNALGTGRIAAGSTLLSAPFGEILVTHSGRDPAASSLQTASLTATSLNRFHQVAGSRIVATGSADIKAGGDIILTDAAGGASFNMDSGATISIDGPVTAQALQLISKDIVIAPAGSLGNAGTTSIAFNIVANGQAAIVGGSGSGGGYTLDAAELGRVASQQIRISAPAIGADPARPADLFVRDMNLGGTQSGPGLARFEIVTPGRVRVDGQVTYANASATDAFLIGAGERVQVVTPAGAILISDNVGRPAGLLGLTAPAVTVANAALTDQLAADPNFPGRSAALLANGGPANPVGYLKAGGITFTIGSHLFVQNSGTATDLAGLTVGPGGLTIRGGATPISVVGFGRRQNPDGSFTTGNAFFALVDFSKAGGTTYSADSEVNLCNVNSGICPPGPPPPPPPTPDPPDPPPPPPDPPPPPPPPPKADPGPAGRPTGPAVVLGPLVPGEARRTGDIIDATLGSVAAFDEPVASGGDPSLWGDDDEEEEEDDDPGGGG